MSLIGAIDCQIRSVDLFSGSNDTFRTANGGYWHIATTDEGDSVAEFITTSKDSPGYVNFKQIWVDTESEETLDNTVVTPNKIFPVRIAANADNIKNDEHWRTLMLGGTFGNITNPAIYNESVFQYFNIPYSIPYPKISEAELSADYVGSTIEIAYDYNEYLPTYQDHISRYTSELLIPNYYVMADLSRWDFAATASAMDLYPPELLNYVSREGYYDNVNDLFAFNNNGLPARTPDWLREQWGDVRTVNTNLSIEYLTASVIQSSLSASTIDWAENKLQTVLFDFDATEALIQLDPLEECLPYRIKINFPTEESGEFIESIKDNKFGPKFIKTLYSTFSGMIEDLSPASRDYITSKEYYSGSINDSIDTMKESNTTSYREIDYIKFLTYCYNNYKGSDANCMFVGESNIYRAAAIENSPMYRHINTKIALETLNHAIDFIENPANAGVTEWETLFSDEERHIETVAYRIEKIGGVASGDSNTQNTLQNYWFVNSSEVETFKFFDNQVKYNTDYTYKVYAYVLAVGIKYRFSDLLLSRDLGCETADGLMMGLELYDPYSDDKATEELFDSTQSDDFSAVAGGATYGSNAQIFSSYPYVADFKLSYEPSIKIIEIPLYSKTLRVLDNPTNRLNVKPYQVMNSSQQVGFDFVYNSFTQTTFPTIIGEEDQTYKSHYMNANDLLESTQITKESISKPRYIEIYRLEERPTSIADFDGNLRNTTDLKIKNVTKYTYTADLYQDTIRTNKKYYYLFRVLNQQRNLSHLSEIYEAQLVNDGGYLYTIFNILFESELEEKVFSKTAREFKKIFQLQPNLSQLQLVTTDVDFNSSAASQVDSLSVGVSDDLIWDKTFKIRLTSKKTGRKIDLNITYNLSSE